MLDSYFENSDNLVEKKSTVKLKNQEKDFCILRINNIQI